MCRADWGRERRVVPPSAPDSIMHYPFDKELIEEPAKCRNGMQHKGGLPDRDKQRAKTLMYW